MQKPATRSRPRRLVTVAVALCAIATSCYSYQPADLQVSFPEQSQTSTVYDRDGVLLTELRADQNRTNVRLAEIPEVMREAIIAIEDERFYIHHGFDLRGLIRSARTNVSAGGIEQGGSTLTQQLVKITQADQLTECFDDDGVTPTRTIQCKVQEINLARRLEQQYNKDFILEQYLNVVFFGNNAYGVQAASEQYFEKDIGQITLAEAALLAGLVQRPSGFDPYEFPDDAETRRRLVLDRMLVNGFITEAEYAEAYDLSVRTIVLNDRQDRSDAAVYEEEFPGPEFVDEVKRWFLDGDDPEIVELFPTYEERARALFAGGLRIHTTLDRSLQARAQEIVYGQGGILPNAEGPDAAAVVMEPGTGHVLAMVAGRDYWADEVHTNLAVAGADNDNNGDPDGGRQAGSSMKPIALAYALQNGWDVTDALPAPSFHVFLPEDYPGIITTPWRVKSGGGGANVTLVTGTRQSYNTLYAELMLRIGPENFVEMAHELGVDRETSPLQPVAAAVLGTEDVTMLDMATVYATFANEGDRVDPTYVTKIVAADGTVIWEHLPQPVAVLSDSVAAQISWVLEGVITEGTAQRNGNIGRPAAGKTGSAQNLADATFIGYVPQLVTAVWVGFPGSQRPMTTATVGMDVFGGTYPTQIWREIMTYALGPEELNLPVAGFPTPPPSTTSTTTTLLSQADLAPVPDVRGMTQANAEATLIAAGFGVVAQPVDSTEGATPGTVVAQSPGPAEQTYLGSEVTIEVVRSSASADPVVPTVVGVAVAEARSVLTSAGFAVSEVNERQPGLGPGQNVGVVWDQQPAAGSTAPAGTNVTLRVNPP